MTDQEMKDRVAKIKADRETHLFRCAGDNPVHRKSKFLCRTCGTEFQIFAPLETAKMCPACGDFSLYFLLPQLWD